jgi:hypothetical protein
VLRWVWVAGVILVAYVLSVGPMCKLAQKGAVSPVLIQRVYVPLFQVCKKWRVLGHFLDLYVEDLWGVK